MKIGIDEREKKKLMWAALTASASGVLNGLFGAGGGILLTFMYGRLCKELSDAFASVVMTVTLMSVFSAWKYYGAGAVDAEMLSRLALPAIIGGYFGAWLSTRMKSGALRTVFAVMLVISGINMAI